jgi:putative membrane protein
MKLLSLSERKMIETAIERAESKTSGEIVFTLADASSPYHHATLQTGLIGMAAATAVYLAVPVVHTVAGVLWSEFISFAAIAALFSRHPWRRWFVLQREIDERVYEAAFMQFYSSGLYKTRESNGIEIYLSCFERRVVVIGDQGIHAKIGNAQWDEIRDTIISGIKKGKACDGICAAIERCGQILELHFPHRPDDVNELPNAVIDRPLKKE